MPRPYSPLARHGAQQRELDRHPVAAQPTWRVGLGLTPLDVGPDRQKAERDADQHAAVRQPAQRRHEAGLAGVEHQGQDRGPARQQPAHAQAKPDDRDPKPQQRVHVPQAHRVGRERVVEPQQHARHGSKHRAVKPRLDEPGQRAGVDLRADGVSVAGEGVEVEGRVAVSGVEPGDHRVLDVVVAQPPDVDGLPAKGHGHQREHGQREQPTATLAPAQGLAREQLGRRHRRGVYYLFSRAHFDLDGPQLGSRLDGDHAQSVR